MSVNYLDFWYVSTRMSIANSVRLDVKQHTSLCRVYVRELRKDLSVTADADDDRDSSDKSNSQRTIARSDLRAAVEKVLYTYILPGSEQEIILPRELVLHMVEAIEKDLRDDPEVFDEAREYVYQAMEREAFPGFVRYASSNVLGKMWIKLYGQNCDILA